MALTITINGTVTLDETAGLQNGLGTPPAGEDNNDSDVSLATLQSDALTFYNRLFTAGGLNLSTTFPSSIGVGESASNFISITGGTVTSLGFVDGNGAALPTYAGVPTGGVLTGLSAVTGGAISLFADPVLGGRMVLGVDAAGDIVFALFLDPNASLTTARVWSVQFEPISDPVSTNPDDPVNLFDSLGVSAGSNLEFGFDQLPSGQNLFGIVGTTDTALVVIGKTPVLNADGTFTNTSNTINTSQGGGAVTIGVNNQMFDPGEGAYFTLVKNPNPAYLSGAPGGLDQNEADDADNILYTGGTLEVNSTFTRISQIQGNALATMKVTAYDIGDSPQGTAFVTGVNGLGTGTVRNITSVRVFNAAGAKIEDTDDLAHFNSATVAVDLTGNTAVVSGLGAGYRIEWTTAGVHDQVLIEGVAGKFDIGSFGSTQGILTPIDIGSQVRWEDDGPTAAIVLGNGSVVHDETAGVQTAASATSGASDDTTAAAVAALFSGVTNISTDLDVDTGTVGSQPGYAQDATPLVTSNSSFGSDGAASSNATVFSLALSDPNGVNSGLDTTEGVNIWLIKEGTLAVGRIGATLNDAKAAGALAAFAVQIDSSTGVVSIAQYHSILHGNASDPDEQANIASGALNAVVTVTDKDGDTSAQSVDIGPRIGFQDDAPSITASATGAPTLTVDETVLATNDTDGFAAQFTPNFGNDGPGATPVTYALSTPGGASGLTDTATGASVVLTFETGQVVGRAGAGGPVVFVVSVNTSGQVTLDQQRAIVHADTTDPDDSRGLTGSNLVVLTATAHDGDGDSASAPLDLTPLLAFEDDGPSITASATGAPTLTVDETVLATNDQKAFAGQFTPSFGADGAAAVPTTYALSTPGGDSGLTDTATGASVVLTLETGQVVGRAGAGGPVVFVVSVNASGQVTLDQQRAIVHADTTDADDSRGLVGSNLVVLTATAHDGDGDTASAPLDLTPLLAFEDDGPTAAITLGAGSVVHDETPGVQTAASATSGPSDDTTAAAVAALFAGVANASTNLDVDIPTAGVQPGFAQDATPLVSSSSTGGADGLASALFSLAVTAAGVDSGLKITEGNSILLYKEGYLVVGRISGGPDNGEAAIAIAINSTTGVVSIAQYHSIRHPNASDPDEQVNIAANAVFAVVTATDGDGDTSAQPVDIGPRIGFQDDSPSAAPQVALPALEEENLAGGNDETPGDKTLSRTVELSDPSIIGPGVDQPASFALDGAAAKLALLPTLTSGGVTLVYSVVDGLTSDTLRARVGAAGPDAFTLVLEEDGTATITLFKPLDHPSGNGENLLAAAIDFTPVIVVRDADGDPATLQDLLSINVVDDVPTIGPIANSIVDFAVGSSATKSLNGSDGADTKTSPYTIETFTTNIVVNGVAVQGVAENSNTQVTYYADTNGDSTFGNAGDTAYYRLSLNQTANSDAGSYTFDVLVNPPPALLTFDFTNLPSGQNLFGTVGTTDTALVVIGKTPMLNADGTFTNASNTINTSQGGGAVTIGINNQMFDAGEGAYFTLVKNPNPAYLSGAPGGLDQNEADDADNILYTGGTLEVNSTFTKISQIQGNTLATMKVTAYDIGDSPQGTAFVTGANGLGTGTVRDITAVRVFNAAGAKIEDTNDLAHFNSAAVAVDLTGNTAVVSGLGSGYRIEWDTAGVHDRVLLEGVAGKFDIGSFGSTQAQPTPDQVLEFLAKVTDFDGDSATAGFKIGIDGTGIFDDGSVLGV